MLLDYLLQPPGTTLSLNASMRFMQHVSTSLFRPYWMAFMRRVSMTITLAGLANLPPHAERLDVPRAVRLDALHQPPGANLVWSASMSFMQHVSTSVVRPRWTTLMRQVSMTVALAQIAVLHRTTWTALVQNISMFLVHRIPTSLVQLHWTAASPTSACGASRRHSCVAPRQPPSAARHDPHAERFDVLSCGPSPRPSCSRTG